MWIQLSHTWQLSCPCVPRGTDMLHVISAQSVARDLDMILPWPHERTCYIKDSSVAVRR